jgi:hypothetical protein
MEDIPAADGISGLHVFGDNPAPVVPRHGSKVIAWADGDLTKNK